jgi:hypothetical protein
LHGTEPICSEYIPSKLYEYLWMQRPILATVNNNPQMSALLIEQGHSVVETQNAVAQESLTIATSHLCIHWADRGLADNGLASPHTTLAAVRQLLGWTTTEATP